MTNEQLQKLIDTMPKGEGVYWRNKDELSFTPICTTDDLASIATELMERREYCEYIISVSYSRGWPFEAWQNAKREGRL